LTPRVAAGAAIALLVAACIPASPTGSATPSAAPNAVDQVLRLRYSEVGSLDPSNFYTDGTVALLVSSLTGLDDRLNTVPAIAKSWDTTEEGRHITFHLREARYSNGAPIAAADFVYSWRRLLDPRVQRTFRFLLSDVVGAADLLAISDDPLPADEVIDALLAGVGVSAPDDRTLEVDLARPAAYFPAVVSHPATAPILESWITQPGATEANAYVSSGPYVLTEWLHDARRTFEPNPLWWGGPSRLTRIEMRTFASDKAALDAYRRGELDMLRLEEGITEAPDLEAQARPVPPANIFFIEFELQKADNPTAVSSELRRALSLATDRVKLNDILQMGGLVAGSFIPPGMPGHDPSLEAVFDPAAARRSLDRALPELGLTSADQLHLSMVYLHDSQPGFEASQTFPAAFGYLKEQWRMLLGIDVEMVGLEYDSWLEALLGSKFDLSFAGFFPDYPHPLTYLSWLTCDAPDPFYCNPAFDELLDQAARTADTDEQLALYAAAQRLLAEDALMIDIVWPGGPALVAPWVEGLVLTPMDHFSFPGNLFFTRVSIAAHD
jgi:oligopeptide transport system substrate-binding protein